ncbi:hypothetical protein HDU97_002455 [Phlyctochytrium planicorne]|nr:hypothetical protein HDU97_002452 [Phlyctochytrium planicorne]KAJ3100174.1 hypothetical protein HDU97_002455 [Phlyctochytrium planicorne]
MMRVTMKAQRFIIITAIVLITCIGLYEVDAQQCSASVPCALGCCSKFGNCGFGSDFCGAGCQNNCDAKPPQTDCGVNGKTTLCPNGACCSKSGYCGYGSDFCGDGCQNNCNAKPPQTDCGVNGKTTLCSNGACCSKSGFCGYGDEFCGAGCQNNCDAKPPITECGKDALPGHFECKLRACCSKFGYCGFGSDFCSNGCQSNCLDLASVPQSNCDGKQLTKVIGYYSNWAYGRIDEKTNCKNVLPNMLPEMVNPFEYTHLYYAFGGIDPNTYEIAKAPAKWPNSNQLADDVLMPRLNNLKTVNPALKTVWSIGGWSFNDPGPTEHTFSFMARDPAKRATFIRSVLRQIPALGFDGVDLDWEYPGSERGGFEEDGQNYLILLKELREAIAASGMNMIVTITAPSGFWFLQQFPIDMIQHYLDWINVMTYDIHGSWDLKFNTGVLPHTGIPDLQNSVNLFIKAGVDFSKISMGLAFYGRTFTLKDTSCTSPACPFTGPGAGGECTHEPGFMSYPEILNLAASSGVKPTLDPVSKTMQLVVGDQWITYDTPETLTIKMNFAKKSCAIGVLIWAVDLDPTGTLISSVSGQVSGLMNGGGQCTSQDGWPTTQAGGWASKKCPLSEGTIKRQCLPNGIWNTKTESSCARIQSKFFQRLADQCRDGGPLTSAAKVFGNRRGGEPQDVWDMLRTRPDNINGVWSL